MLSLKPEEIRFWEAAFVASLTGSDRHIEYSALDADTAVELRRKRLKQPEQAKTPYREPGAP